MAHKHSEISVPVVGVCLCVTHVTSHNDRKNDVTFLALSKVKGQFDLGLGNQYAWCDVR